MDKQEEKIPRKLQAERMREKIQNIVFEMSKTKALDDIKIRDIAKAANISVGNFYQYFDSREAALIYSYKTKDDIWESLHLEKIKDPLKRVERMVVTHLYSMTENSLCFDTQLYIAQLKQYEEYFFTNDRYIHRMMEETIAEGQKKGEFITTLTNREMRIRILNFSRGLVYNYCIEHKEDTEKWFEYALELQTEYMKIFVTDPSKVNLKKHVKEVRKK